MGRFDNIKTAIDTNINTNGNQAITGAVMNSVMKQTVDSVDTQLTELESETNAITELEIAVLVSRALNLATGELIYREDQDISEKITLYKDTTVVEVRGGFVPLRYVWYLKDNTYIQDISPNPPHNAYALRLLFSNGEYATYEGLTISQDGSPLVKLKSETTELNSKIKTLKEELTELESETNAIAELEIAVLVSRALNLATGELIYREDQDISEKITLYKDTTVVEVRGGFVPLRYVWYLKDNTYIQEISPNPPHNAYALRLLFSNGEYATYEGLTISQDGSPLVKLKSETTELNSKIKTLNEEISTRDIGIEDFTEQGYYDKSGIFGYHETYKSTGLIKVKRNTPIEICCSASKNVAVITFFDNQKRYVASVPGVTTGRLYNITSTYICPSDGYVAFSCSSLKYCRVNYNIPSFDKDDKLIKPSGVVTTLGYDNSQYFLQERQGIVSFVFDDGVLNDDTIVSIFREHNMRCGFALPHYDKRYIPYINDGFEVLAHGDYAIPETTTTSEFNTYLQGVLNELSQFNIPIRGWITPSSQLPTHLVGILPSYFEWGATIYKGAEHENVGITKDTNPYKLYRPEIDSNVDYYRQIIEDARVNGKVVIFYSHAVNLNEQGQNLTTELLYNIIDYCNSLKVEILPPTMALRKLYAIRRSDLVGTIYAE